MTVSVVIIVDTFEPKDDNKHMVTGSTDLNRCTHIKQHFMELHPKKKCLVVTSLKVTHRF